MNEVEDKTKGYVYILEVEDIELPVCKIGRTTRNPTDRCAEINSSSTGDFIWAVAHYIGVDDCKKLEALVHSKLAPLRQKRREFFNICADDALEALNSIINSQSKIRRIDSLEIVHTEKDETSAKKRKAKDKRDFSIVDTEYAELLQTFTSVLHVKGRPFGQTNIPRFGMHDDNKGVQWNLTVHTDTGNVRIGVHLAGKEYNNWPISKFILSEIKNPKIKEVRDELNKPDEITIQFRRNAWQVQARPPIVENFIGGREFSFAEISLDQWSRTLSEALDCLNKAKNYCGRGKQTVTLEKKPKKGEQVRDMWVSPSLTIWSFLNLGGDLHRNIERTISELQPVYNWVKRVSRAEIRL